MSSFKIELPRPASGRLPVIDELKGLAILLIVLYHAGGVLTWDNRLHGDIGVDMFVVLSGVGLALGSGFTNTREFLTKRLLRIMPAYWVALTFFLILHWLVLDNHYPVGDVVAHIFGIHAWINDTYAFSINDSFWFITLILTLYVLYCRMHALSDGDLLFWGALVSIVIAVTLLYAVRSGTFGHIGLRMPGFFIGILLGRLLKTGRLEFSAGPAIGGTLFLLAYVPYTQGFIFAQLMVGIAMMGFYAFAVRPMLAERFPKVTVVLAFFGIHSLEIFLLHQPLLREYIIYGLARFGGINPPTTPALFFAMPIGFAIAVVLSVELKQFLKKIPLLSK